MNHIKTIKKTVSRVSNRRDSFELQSVQCRAHVRCAPPKGSPPSRPRSIVAAVLIYNTIKTHGKTVDAILVINWGTSYSQHRHHSRHWVFMCSYKLFVLIVAFCFAVNCFLFASWSEILIGIFRSYWSKPLIPSVRCSLMAFCLVAVASPGY